MIIKRSICRHCRERIQNADHYWVHIERDLLMCPDGRTQAEPPMVSHEQMTIAEFAREFVAPREIAGDLTRDRATRVLWEAARIAQLDLTWEEIKTFYAQEYDRAQGG